MTITYSDSTVDTSPTYENKHIPSKEHVSLLKEYISYSHLASFDYFLENGIENALQDIEHYEIDLLTRDEENSLETVNTVKSMEFWLENVKIGLPRHSTKTNASTNESVPEQMTSTPRQCRELRTTYGAPLTLDICYRFNEKRRVLSTTSSSSPTITKFEKLPTSTPAVRNTVTLGDIPIMVCSSKCSLYQKSPHELIKLKEEASEFGGYFIINGVEKCIRMLQVPRRNHAMAIQRSNFKSRGALYTEYGVSIRCANICQDMSTITNTLHYLTSGGVTLKLLMTKQEQLIPILIILRALGNGITDEEIFHRITMGADASLQKTLSSRVLILLQDFSYKYSSEKVSNEIQCVEFLGRLFRTLLRSVSSTTSDYAAGQLFLKQYVLIHLSTNADKQECLIQMIKKLFYFVSGDCSADNQDSFCNHDILVPGHLFCMFIKEQFRRLLENASVGMLIHYRKTSDHSYLSNTTMLKKLILRYCGKESVCTRLKKLVSVGELESKTGCDLMQVAGFSIVAERLNYWRFVSHFRSIHRGAFFTTMKTTTVRKLLPDSWGFLCPVHTPDGSPCGLLNHLSIACQVVCRPLRSHKNELERLETLILKLGVTSCKSNKCESSDMMCVWLDGKVIGYTQFPRRIADALRDLKVIMKVPPTLEVAYIPFVNKSSPFPGLYIFVAPGRAIRPVVHRKSGKVETIGPMEQPFLDIACLQKDIEAGRTTHQEINPTNMLSLLANFTPFSDYNQSPRNMYQCQMGKQTMGTPSHAIYPYRADNKMYKLLHVQAPIVSTKLYRDFKMDEYPNGCNAVVAVLSYTGFDMEDSVVINKSSFQRGFGHASVYKTYVLELNDIMHSTSNERYYFGNQRPAGKERTEDEKKYKGMKIHKKLDLDGLPHVGEFVENGDAFYSVVDELTGHVKKFTYKDKERAYIQTVRLLNSGKKGLEKVTITVRIERNPVVGDKFSSRHGQKGVMSLLWNQHDMPFSESGISPDLIINPHAFPSRMTIGMLIESMAAKSGALHGIYQDATPFTFHETGSKLAIDYFGEQLQAAGYSYYGSEPLYSGTSGEIMHADLYIGVVFYQRLRHMVLDKFQVRSTGPINPLTRQPVKGRKRGGGIRLGEMERDSLISHGISFCINDRLLNCSDSFVMNACTRCGDLLLPTTERSDILSVGQTAADARNDARLRQFCRNPDCRTGANASDENDDHLDSPHIEPVILPYVYWYLTNELAAMNIRLKLDFN